MIESRETKDLHQSMLRVSNIKIKKIYSGVYTSSLRCGPSRVAALRGQRPPAVFRGAARNRRRGGLIMLPFLPGRCMYCMMSCSIRTGIGIIWIASAYNTYGSPSASSSYYTVENVHKKGNFRSETNSFLLALLILLIVVVENRCLDNNIRIVLDGARGSENISFSTETYVTYL